MEISKETLHFWLAVETDLNINIPSHIKNVLTAFGYTNAVSITKIDHQRINEMEQFIKDEFLELLQGQVNQFNIEEIFGTKEINPNQFEFTIDERNLMMRLKNHFCYITSLDDVQTALENFYMDEDVEENAPFPKTEQPQTKTHMILNKFLETANQNAYRKKEGYRYSESVKRFSAFFRILAGRQAYGCVQMNLFGAMPSTSSTDRYIQETSHRMCEGVLSSQELLLYLEKRGLPLCVGLSEDATRIQGKVQYDPYNNQLIGFVLPTNHETGMPLPFVYKARNAEEIVGHFLTAKSANFVNTIMAQPIANVPPFCLLVFGSNSNYTAEDVFNRWNYITNELKKLNITVISISSDSDPKYNKAMRMCSSLGIPSKIRTEVNWFSCGDDINAPFFTQDTVHLATKSRNGFLKTIKIPEKLPFGNFFIQVKHLEELLNKYPKDMHRLTATTLNPKDRQNYDSVLRICDPIVIDMLKRNIRGSDGTAKFLQIIKNFIDSYLDVELTPLERVYKIWYSLFIIRIWRSYILNSTSKTLKDNFITSNLYTCMEQNAHTLLLIMVFLKRNGLSHLFKPWLFSSQPCEGFYRLIRSLTSTFSTVANCTVKEILERINKIQLLGDISNDTNTIFSYPQKLKPTHETNEANENMILPSQEEIINTIEECKSAAIKDAAKFGLLKKGSEVNLKCQVPPAKHVYGSETNNEPILTNFEQRFSLTLAHLINITLKNYAQKFGDNIVEENSPYVEILGGRRRLIVRKTSLVWLLRDDTLKLSSDRLQRVMATKQTKMKKTKHFTNAILNKKSTRKAKSK